MTHEEVGKYWNANAEAWTRLARAGYDVYRDYLNTPAFFEMLPPVNGLCGLDIGCGEGHNTRMLAKQGARMAAVDISEAFISYAKETEEKEKSGIDYHVASAVDLPFPDSSFDFATGFMSFMDIPETGQVLAEVFRVIRPGGFLQFSIEHPCFATTHRKNLRDKTGKTYAIEVGGYFDRSNGAVAEWIFGSAPAEVKKQYQKFRTPRFTRTTSEWLNMAMKAGFVLEEIREPRPSDETVRQCADMQDAQVVAYFLHIRARKSEQQGRKN